MQMTEPSERNRVQVALRIRPVTKLDKDVDKVVARVCDSNTVAIGGERDMRTYSFDHVLAADQNSVFKTIGQPMVVEAYKGFNVCLFAYGQTGSGKTYSLLGDMKSSELCGITPRLVRQLFDEAQRLVEEDPDLAIKMSLSMIEIYMEKLRDLLAPLQHGQEPEQLEIHEDTNHRVYVKGVSVHPVLGFERMMELISSGNANRQVAETKMNETSSRSHAIIQITMQQEFRSTGKRDLECTISLVDLAGSERQGKADSSGQSFEEAKKINYSLLMLGRTLNSFSERKGGDAFIPLRESKLTRLLSESFGGNSKTWMLATVSPTAYNLVETISTLDYAKNAMAITNKAHINKLTKVLDVRMLRALTVKLEISLDKLVSERKEKEMLVFNLEKNRNALQLVVEMAQSQNVTNNSIQKGFQQLALANHDLKRRIEASSQGMIWALDNEVSFLFFKGRCGINLEGVLLGVRRAFCCALETDKGSLTSTKLNLQLFPIGLDVQECEDPMKLVNKDISFCLHVVGAENIPSEFSTRTFCQIKLRCDQGDHFVRTSIEENTCDPKWGLIKQFQIPKLSHEVISDLLSKHLFTFEVYGFSV
ncbi:unnamed protein product [Phytomonas sp. Hart1]|nr:unnamed protein product [Phytomonas sp. Hart1]|eukprot:CCW67290.1 unnamed protein product [Phytomonas sp. isolate Hart1]